MELFNLNASYTQDELQNEHTVFRKKKLKKKWIVLLVASHPHI